MSKFFIGAIPVDLFTDLLLKEVAGGDAQKIAARATDGIQVIDAVESLLNGDPTSFVNELAAVVFRSETLSPGEALAIQNATFLAQTPALITKLLSGTMLAAGEIAIATQVLEEARKVCQGFIDAAKPAAPAASPQ